MQHKCVQVRRGSGDKTMLFFCLFFGHVIFVKGTQLKINFFSVSVFFAVSTSCRELVTFTNN